MEFKNSKISQELTENQIFYKHLAEVTPEAVVIHSKGEIVYVNTAALKLVGAKSRKELLGKKVMDFIHPDSLPLIQSRIEKMLNNKKVAPFVEEKFFNLKREVFVAETKAVPFMFQGKPAILAILHDITKRKKTEERQKFLEEVSILLGASIDYKTTLQTISKLIVPYLADYIRIAIVDKNNQIEEIVAYHSNPKHVNLVKKLYESYRNMSNSTHGVNHVLQSGKAEIMEIVASQTTAQYKQNTQMQHIIAELGLTSYMGVPLKVTNTVIGVITFSSTKKERIYTKDDLQFATEIAGRIAYAIENARHFANAQKAITLRDDFISLASHELKTPITSLKMYVQSLSLQVEKKNDINFPQYFQKMDQQINKLILLINDLLDVSKITHGKLAFNMEDVNLNTLVKDTVDAIQETTTHKITVLGEMKESVYADPYRIYQVLTNLLTNAIKYSPKATKVTIQILPKIGHAMVIIEDFGIGIEPSQQKKIFTQFYRVTNIEEKTFPGLGMGLFISNEIIKRHDGKMSVISEKGKGSKFIFTVPYKTLGKSN